MSEQEELIIPQEFKQKGFNKSSLSVDSGKENRDGCSCAVTIHAAIFVACLYSFLRVTKCAYIASTNVLQCSKLEGEIGSQY